MTKPLVPVELQPVAQAAADDPSAAVLQGLRGLGRARPSADRLWSAGLRERLEDALGPVVAERGGVDPLQLTWSSLHVELDRSVVARAPHRSLSSVGLQREWTSGAAPAPTAQARLLDVLVRVVFRQLVVTGVVRDPLADALAGLQAAGDRGGVGRAVANLGAAERRHLADELSAHSGRLAACWPSLDARWAPRTGEQLTAVLAGGRVVLSASVDLSIGPPARTTATVGLVSATAGGTGSAPWRRLALAALIETLRAGVPPFQVAVVSTATGSLDVLPVDPELLVALADATIAGTRAGTRTGTHPGTGTPTGTGTAAGSSGGGSPGNGCPRPACSSVPPGRLAQLRGYPLRSGPPRTSAQVTRVAS